MAVKFFNIFLFIILSAILISSCSINENSSSVPVRTDDEPEKTTIEIEQTVEFVTIDGEQYPIDLTEIEVYVSTQEEINELSMLKNLKKLKLGSCVYQPNLSPLSELTNLKNLYIFDDVDYIFDYSVLAEFTKLEQLGLMGRTIDDISMLSGLKNLKELKIQSWHLTDISPLTGLDNLVSLTLCSPNSFPNELTDISPLSQLTNLEYLALYRNEISDISPLKNLTNLKHLNLKNNLIALSDIDELIGLLPDCEIACDYPIYESSENLQTAYREYFNGFDLNSVENIYIGDINNNGIPEVIMPEMGLLYYYDNEIHVVEFLSFLYVCHHYNDDTNQLFIDGGSSGQYHAKRYDYIDGKYELAYHLRMEKEYFRNGEDAGGIEHWYVNEIEINETDESEIAKLIDEWKELKKGSHCVYCTSCDGFIYDSQDMFSSVYSFVTRSDSSEGFKRYIEENLY